MNNQNLSKKLFSLKETAQKLNVTADTLIKWNELNILKPTITSEGTIGYTEDQINQFLSIRHIAQVKTEQVKLNIPHQLEKQQNPNEIEFGFTRLEDKPKIPTPNLIDSDDAKNNYFAFNQGITLYTKIASSNMLSVGISFVIIASILSFAVISQTGQNSSDSLSKIPKSFQKLGVQTSKVKVPEITSVPTPVVYQNASTQKEKLDTQESGVLHSKIYSRDSLFSVPPVSNPDDSKESVPSSFEDKDMFSEIIDNDATTASTYASRGTSNEDSDLVFDNSGMIKGEAVDSFSTALGGLGVLRDSFPKQVAAGPFNGIAVLTLGILSMLFIFPRSLAFAGKSSNKNIHIPDSKVDPMLTKIIEVDQKTDGTIILYFQNKEYKISKPELYSESDQFIERLMDLVKPGIKEIEYVSQNDSNIDTTTPLSRLVTRLGFVGVKRDLFFPRTSKERVHFRKYITSQDLVDMNLTTFQILEDLTLTN